MTLKYYKQEEAINWPRLDCVLSELNRIWSIELSEANKHTSK